MQKNNSIYNAFSTFYDYMLLLVTLLGLTPSTCILQICNLFYCWIVVKYTAYAIEVLLLNLTLKAQEPILYAKFETNLNDTVGLILD